MRANFGGAMNEQTRWLRRVSIAAGVALSYLGQAAASPRPGTYAQMVREPKTTMQVSGTSNRLQAVSPVDENVVWASGLNGTYVVTTDGGATWRAGVVPGAETLQFRDVQAVSEGVAYLLAAGQGSNSRIYKTENGGRNWTLQFVAPDDPSYFYDCFAFWTPERGITMADGINATGQFPAIRTTDGKKWKDISLPAAQKDEGAFAASGTCVATLGETRAWIVTTNSRVFASSDRGERWASYLTPIAGGTGTSGVFTVAFRDGRHGVIGGGDFSSARILDNFARSRDGGKTWHLTPQAPVPGAIFGLAYAQSMSDRKREVADEDRGRGDSRQEQTKVVVTGPGGAAWTTDEGENWNPLPDVAGYWAVAFANEHDGWLVGTGGRILKITF